MIAFIVVLSLLVLGLTSFIIYLAIVASEFTH